MVKLFYVANALVSPEDAEQAGISLAEELLDKGARGFNRCISR